MFVRVYILYVDYVCTITITHSPQKAFEENWNGTQRNGSDFYEKMKIDAQADGPDKNKTESGCFGGSNHFIQILFRGIIYNKIHR